jgi:hypothetical protein
MFRFAMIKFDFLELHARGRLARALEVGGAEGEAHLRIAAADARAIRKLGREWATPTADLLDGVREATHGDPAQALAHLEQAAAGFDKVPMRIHAAVARLRAGQITEGELGRERTAKAEKELRETGVVAPAKWADMLAPGRFRASS